MLSFLSRNGFGSPVTIRKTMSPRLIIRYYEETFKHESKSKGDSLMIQRNAFHAEDIEKLHKQLMSAGKKDPGLSPEQIMANFSGR